MLDIDIDDEVVEQKSDSVEDEGAKAVRMAFIGAGQAGNNLADSFYKLGYRRVCAINTTDKDMKRLSIPEDNRLVLESTGGAGKDPVRGKEAADKSRDNIRDLMQKCWKKDVEQVMICVGAGGGTGSGSVEVLYDLALEYMEQELVKDSPLKIGVMVTLPSKDESSVVKNNAAKTMQYLCRLVEKGKLSPLVIVDNSRALKMYGGASVIDMWAKVNKNVTALFDVFNVLAAQDDESVHITFDPEDYKSVLKSGILAFGRTKLDAVSSPYEVANAIRDNVKKGLLAEDMDVSKSTAGAGILVSNHDGLSSISSEWMEEAFRALNSIVSKSKDTKIHRGVYEAKSNGVHLYTLLSGLGRPAEYVSGKNASTKVYGGK